MTEWFTDAADRTGLDARGRRIALTMPGIGFGFFPGHFDAFIERIDCATCSRIMDVIDESLRPTSDAREDAVRLAPVRARNAERKAAFERRRAWPLIGRFFREPAYEPEVARADILVARIEALKRECPAHWGNPAARAISETLMGTYVRSDRRTRGGTTAP